MDQKEAREILGCSRATFFRRIKDGDLHQIHVADDRTVYVTLQSLMDYKTRGPQFQLKKLEPDDVRELKEKHIRLRFPQYADGLDLPEPCPGPDPLPSEEE